MSNLEAIADRVEIEALRGEFTDAAMMRDYDRLASLFTPDGALRIPDANVELAGREEIRAWGGRVPAVVDYLVPAPISIVAPVAWASRSCRCWRSPARSAGLLMRSYMAA